MDAEKLVITSRVLDRMAHADVFRLGADPSFLFLIIGGSGMSGAEYDRRRNSVIPVFRNVLNGIDGLQADFVLVYVTAPYDIPLKRIEREPQLGAIWATHVLGELLLEWKALPYFVCGFSGGVLLALGSLAEHARCFGGAALGADALPSDFECPPHWRHPLQVYSGRLDAVSRRDENLRARVHLQSTGQAEIVEMSRGGHQLVDYATQECLGELFDFAAAIAPRP